MCGAGIRNSKTTYFDVLQSNPWTGSAPNPRSPKYKGSSMQVKIYHQEANSGWCPKSLGPSGLCRKQFWKWRFHHKEHPWSEVERACHEAVWKKRQRYCRLKPISECTHKYVHLNLCIPYPTSIVTLIYTGVIATMPFSKNSCLWLPQCRHL